MMSKIFRITWRWDVTILGLRKLYRLESAPAHTNRWKVHVPDDEGTSSLSEVAKQMRMEFLLQTTDVQTWHPLPKVKQFEIDEHVAAEIAHQNKLA